MERVGRLGAGLVGFVGLAVLVGWYSDIGWLTTVAPGFASMKPNTAGCLITLAIAVAAFDRRSLAAPLGALVAALGAVTLLEYALGRPLGIDLLLPGLDLGSASSRMAPATALAILLLGAGITAGALGRMQLMRGQAIVAFGVGQVAVLGYAYGVSSLYSVGGYTSMALHTSLCIVLLSLSMLLLDPSGGLVGLLRTRGSAGKMLRPLVPFLLVGPPVLGWLRLEAQDHGWFDTRFGVAVLVMSMTVLGGALSWRAAVQLDELDAQREAARADVDETNRTLEAKVAERTSQLADRQSFTDALLENIEVGIVSCDADGNNVVRNRAQREMAGLQAVEGHPADWDSRVEVLDNDGFDLAPDRHPLLRTLRGEHLGALDLLIGPHGGPHREVVARGSQIVGVTGAVLGAVVLLTDVTVERTASRALDEQRRQLVEAQRIGQLGSFAHDFVTGVWTFSDQLYALWGVQPGGLIPGVTENLIVEEDRERAWAAWREASLLGGQHIYDYRIKRANDGAERIIRSSVEVELGPEGRPLRGRGTHLDITDLTLAERAAQRANAFFEAVLTATPDYTFVTDLATGGVLYGSPGKEILGITSERLEGLGRDAISALVHPDDQPRLRALNVAARDLADGQVLELRYRGLHADGQWRWLKRRVTPFRRDKSGRVVEVLGVLRDITDVMNAEQRLTQAALHDSITGLPNRAFLVDRLDAALTRSGRDHREVAVLFCDLDGFKRVNDTAGHAAGDALLLEIAHRLTAVLRDGDTVARVGGDEFVIIIEPWNRPLTGDQKAAPHPHGADRQLALRVARRVTEVVRQPVNISGTEHVVTASIGITYAQLTSSGSADAVTAEQVLQDADAAMYVAKGRGKNRVEVFEHRLRTNVPESGEMQQASW